ncbi:uncharacterized protein G2W53_004914 [Senna tora]|uniref:Uncharacterized protein n=1 Tax=Senna tora TaxID=362788 RepID=A0A834XEN9_9FABA|nr:uncharacterized protein G2W53_004914 [Senna tora]
MGIAHKEEIGVFAALTFERRRKG